MEGIVKFYNRTKRFGFITGNDGNDYFFHETGIEPGNNVRDEDKVSFEVVEGDRGPKAEHVKLVDGEESSEESDETPADESVEESADESDEMDE